VHAPTRPPEIGQEWTRLKGNAPGAGVPLTLHRWKLPKKLDPRVVYDKVVGNSSLTTYGRDIDDDLDVKSLRKEITRLSWQ